MPPKSPVALVEKELLVWARTDARLDVAYVERKLKLKSGSIGEWEAGPKRPSIAQLRKLAKLYQRPLAVFFLPAPPVDFKPIRDFRRYRGDSVPELSHELVSVIREARERREIALALWEELSEPPSSFVSHARLDEDPENVGERLLELLKGAAVGERQEPGSGALKFWRVAAEALGVLVFQSSDIPDASRIRGISLSEDPAPVIVLNRPDAENGRVFTLLHEMSHLMLRAGGLCDTEERGPRPPQEERTEVFCNRVAGAALVPRKALLSHPLVKSHVSSWTVGALAPIAQSFSGASREVIARRLLTFGKMKEAEYEQLRRTLNSQYAEARRQEREKRRREGARGGLAPARDALSLLGLKFIRLVLEARGRDRITSSDTSAFLDVRVKQIPKIAAEMLRAQGGG